MNRAEAENELSRLVESLWLEVFDPGGWRRRGKSLMRTFWKATPETTVALVVVAKHRVLAPAGLDMALLTHCMVHALDPILHPMSGSVAPALPVPTDGRRVRLPTHENIKDISRDGRTLSRVIGDRCQGNFLELTSEADRMVLHDLLVTELNDRILPVLRRWETVDGVLDYVRETGSAGMGWGSAGELLWRVGAMRGDESLFSEGIRLWRDAFLSHPASSLRKDPLTVAEPYCNGLRRVVRYARQVHHAPKLFEGTLRALGVADETRNDPSE